MSEPITLYKDGDEVTIYAPSEVKRMMADGWTVEPEADDVPFSFAPEDDTQEVDVVPVKAKRGRPRKAKA